jgi:hypothetical protein
VPALLGACGAPARVDRAPDVAELARLRAGVAGVAAQRWSAQGYARLQTDDGEVEGRLEVRIDAPTRAWLRVTGSGVFGMVSDGLTIAMPGDGSVLTHRARTDELQRFRYDETIASTLTPNRQSSDVFALALASPPWRDGQVPGDLEARTRVVAVDDGGRTVEYRIVLPDGGDYVLRLEGERLVRWEWWQSGRKRVEARYERWQDHDGVVLPARILVQAATDDVRAEVHLDAWVRRDDFTLRDFEVY